MKYKLNKSWQPFIDICKQGNDLAVIDKLCAEPWPKLKEWIPFEVFDLRSMVRVYSIALSIARIAIGDDCKQAYAWDELIPFYKKRFRQYPMRFSKTYAYCRCRQYLYDEPPCDSCSDDDKCRMLETVARCGLEELMIAYRIYYRAYNNRG